jgi:outer membrane protein OmpA-like peptidoglycan-associated protein
LLHRLRSAEAAGASEKLLTSDKSLQVYIVGHTDNQGTMEGNRWRALRYGHYLILRQIF